jgi:Flp pilus assembly pilin Flp
MFNEVIIWIAARHDRRPDTAIDYAIIGALVAAVIVAALGLTGGNTYATLTPAVSAV